MDRALRVAEFDVIDEALGALGTHTVDVAIIQYTRDGRTPYCLLYLLKSASNEIRASLARFFDRVKVEDVIVTFEADNKDVDDVLTILFKHFDVEVV